MDRVLMVVGWLGGLVGISLCVFAVVWRGLGYHWMIGFELITLLQVGIAAIVSGCFFLLATLVFRTSRRF